MPPRRFGFPFGTSGRVLCPSRITTDRAPPAPKELPVTAGTRLHRAPAPGPAAVFCRVQGRQGGAGRLIRGNQMDCGPFGASQTPQNIMINVLSLPPVVLFSRFPLPDLDPTPPRTPGGGRGQQDHCPTYGAPAGGQSYGVGATLPVRGEGGCRGFMRGVADCSRGGRGG